MRLGGTACGMADVTGATFWLIIEVVILQDLSGFCKTQTDELNEKMIGNITPASFRWGLANLQPMGYLPVFKVLLIHS